MTTIEWTDETWNPTTGCDRISPGCDHCYALTMAARLKGMGSAKYQNDGDSRTSGPGFALTVHPDTLDAPMRWRKPRKVFVNSMSDLFHQDAPDDFIAHVFAVMALTPHHTYQVLTKRPQRMADLLNLPGFVASVMSEILAIPGCTKDQRDAAWCWPLFWPVPPDERRPGWKKSKRSGAKAKVRLPNGDRISVATEHLYPLEGAPHG